MAKKNKIISLRERTLASGDKSLFLDYYVNGKRRQEFLGLYIKPEDSRAAKEANRKTRLVAETIRARRVVDLQNEKMGIATKTDNTILVDYMLNIANEKPRSYDVWLNAIKKMQKFLNGSVVFVSDVNEDFVRKYRDYLVRDDIKESSANLYLSKLKATLNRAKEDKLVKEIPNIRIKITKSEARCYLTIDELRSLVATKSAVPEWLWRAFLFACSTGLRMSDVQNLKWGDVQEIDGMTRIVFSQQKTGELQYLDISKDAASLIGERGGNDDYERVFSFRSKMSVGRLLEEWCKKAGVSKHVTFHVARHTFATLALTAGVDIYTVSKLLGHTDVKTTQIYAKIIDDKKREAVSKLPKIL